MISTHWSQQTASGQNDEKSALLYSKVRQRGR